MELLPGADLSKVLDALRNNRGSSIDKVLDGDASKHSDHIEESGLFEGGQHRTAARIALRLARTIARVHEHGIVHRDIKPSNVMIDRGGRVTIVDFGLAHLTDSGELTKTGAMLGSLPYMAPEQVRCERALIGPRTDVYAIGVTLHELVYLEPLFAADDQVDLAARIADGRRARRDGPRDLETIIACATDPDPARRYGSADELADDLQRFLEFRPIHSRPSGFALRAVRWSQRNRTVAISAFALLAVAVLIPTAIAIERSATAGQLQTALTQAKADRDKYELALPGVIDILGEARPLLAQVAESDEGGQSSKVGALFETMIGFYAQLRQLDPQRESIQRALIMAQSHEAELQADLSNWEQAMGLSETVLELSRDFKDAERIRFEMRMIRARIAESRGNFVLAETEWAQALAELGPDRGAAIDELLAGRCLLMVANAAAHRTDPDTLAAAEAAAIEFERVCTASPQNIQAHCFLSNARRLKAQTLGREGQRDAGIALLAVTATDLRTQLAQHPRNRTICDQLAHTEHAIAVQHRSAGQHAAAIPHLEEAVRLRREFRIIWPFRTVVVAELSKSLANLGSSLNLTGEPDRAIALLEEVRHLLLEQLTVRPDVEEFEERLVQVYMELGASMASRDGPSEESHAMHEGAVALIDKVVGRKQDVLMDLYGVRSVARAMCAQSHLALGRNESALQIGLLACEDMRRLLSGGQVRPLMRRQLGQLTLMMAFPAAHAGDAALVEKLLAECADLTGFEASDVAYLPELLGDEQAKTLLAKFGK